MAISPKPAPLACLIVDAVSLAEPISGPSRSGVQAVGPMARFGAGTMLDQQLAALWTADVRQAALLVDGVVPGLDDVLAQWREKGLHIEVFLDRAALLEFANEFELMLILAHNLVATAQTVTYALAQKEPTLFVRDAATSDERHERIDLNDRWTGIAILPVKYLNELPDLAEDWSIQSALLRHAVQKDVRRETMAVGPAAPLQSAIIVDFGDVDRWQSRVGHQHFDQQFASATPFRRWFSLPLAWMVLPLLWERQREAAQLVTWGRYALLVMAFILALLQWLPAALCLVFPLLLVEEVDRQYDELSPHRRGDTMASLFYWGAWFAFPIIGIMSVEGMPYFGGFLLGGVLSSAVVASAAMRPANETWVVARQEAVIVSLAGIIIGLSIADSALATSLTVLISGFWRPILSRLKAI